MIKCVLGVEIIRAFGDVSIPQNDTLNTIHDIHVRRYVLNDAKELVSRPPETTC